MNPVILMGWSEAQTNHEVGAVIRSFQGKYREALIHVARQWRKQKYLGPHAEPEEVGKALLSFFLGSIVQQALLGDADPETLTRGMEGIMTAVQKPLKPTRKVKKH